MIRKLTRRMQAVLLGRTPPTAAAVGLQAANPPSVAPINRTDPDRSQLVPKTDPGQSGSVGTVLTDRSGSVRSGRSKPEPPPPISPRRKPDVAIRCFIEDMQGFNSIGEFGWRPLPSNPLRNGIYKFYLDHCAAERTTPLPAHTFQQWLAKHPAVERYQVKVGASELTAYYIHDSIDRYWINHEGDHDAGRPPH